MRTLELLNHKILGKNFTDFLVHFFGQQILCLISMRHADLNKLWKYLKLPMTKESGFGGVRAFCAQGVRFFMLICANVSYEQPFTALFSLLVPL